MKIAVIDNFDSFVFNLVRYLREIPEVEVIVQRNNKINHSILKECDAILLSPGPGIPSEAGSLMGIIECYHTSKPILGICLGHQAIGEYFGAQLKKCINPIHGKSSTTFIRSESILFNGLHKSFEIGRYHSWIIDNQNVAQFHITTSLENGEIMGVKHKMFDVEGVQFHPESILTPSGRKMIQNWVINNKYYSNSKK